MLTVFRMTAEGLENVPARGRRGARAHAPLLRRHAGRRRAAKRQALPRDGQVRAVPGAAARQADRVRRRLPGEPRRAGHGGLRDRPRPAARGRHAARVPRGHAQSRRQRAAAAGRGAARDRGRSGLRPGLDRRQRRHQLLAAALTADPRLLRRADPARRPAGGRSAACLVHGHEALDGGHRGRPRDLATSAMLRRRAGRSGAGGARAARTGARCARVRPDRRRRSRT